MIDCRLPEAREEGISTAAEAVFRGECVVLPTDTVYGIGADAFNPTAVGQLLEAKGRGRDMPPPVLIPSRQTVDGLAMNVPSYAGRLMDAFWPGGLTLVFRAQQSLAWDLGDTNGTVGLRMPDDDIALALLESTGPLAVSSANRTGKPSATTVTEAGFMLGHFVDIYLDGGERGSDTPSTVLDCTKADPVVLREGAVGNEELQKVLGDVELVTGRAINSPVPETDADEADEFELPDAHGGPDGSESSLPDAPDAPAIPDEVDADQNSAAGPAGGPIDLGKPAAEPDDARPADEQHPDVPPGELRSSADAPERRPTLGQQYDADPGHGDPSRTTDQVSDQ